MKYEMSFPSFVKRLDMFGEPVPQFKIGGKDVMQTSVGTIFSILTIMLTCAYGLLQF